MASGKNQPGTTQPPVISANCEEGCFLAYTAGGCTACDLANENWKCVSSEENQRINKMRQKYDQDPNGHQCALCMPEQSLVEFRCVCENGNCVKTSACENDADCSSPVGGKWFGDKYKCVNNQCRIDQSNQGSSQLSNVDTSDWKTYRNDKYGYEIKYPEDWTLKEVNYISDFVPGTKVEYIVLYNPNSDYFLTFGLTNKGSNIKLSDRTGFGAGDILDGDIVKIGNTDVKTKKLVWQGKVKTVLYPHFEINGFLANAEFDCGKNVDYMAIDMTGSQELKMANQILSTFKFID